MSNELTSIKTIIKALGTTSDVAEMTGVTRQAVSNWIMRGRIPPETFVVLSEELRRRGLSAPASLWGMVESKASASSDEERMAS